MWNLSSRGISKNWPNSISCTDSSPTRRELLRSLPPDGASFHRDCANTHAHTHTYGRPERKYIQLCQEIAMINESSLRQEWYFWISDRSRHVGDVEIEWNVITTSHCCLHTATHTAYTHCIHNIYLKPSPTYTRCFIHHCLHLKITHTTGHNYTIIFRYYIILLNNLDIILYSYYDFFCQFIWHTR